MAKKNPTRKINKPPPHLEKLTAGMNMILRVILKGEKEATILKTEFVSAEIAI